VPYASILAAGTGVPKDEVTARALFERAAERGDAGAQWSLGVFHEEGRAGFTPDVKEAVRWWRLAAEQGQPYAQVKLGMAYLTGKGVQSSVVEGYAWLSASEVSEAQPMLREIEKKMVAPLLAKAKRLADERRALRKPKLQPASSPQPPPQG